MGKPEPEPSRELPDKLPERCAHCGHGWLAHHDYDYGLMRYYPSGCDHWSQCICKSFVKLTTLAESPR